MSKVPFLLLLLPDLFVMQAFKVVVVTVRFYYCYYYIYGIIILVLVVNDLVGFSIYKFIALMLLFEVMFVDSVAKLLTVLRFVVLDFILFRKKLFPSFINGNYDLLVVPVEGSEDY